MIAQVMGLSIDDDEDEDGDDDGDDDRDDDSATQQPHGCSPRRTADTDSSHSRCRRTD